MKKTIFIFLLLFFLPVCSSAIDLKDLGNKLEQSGLKEPFRESLGVNLDNVTNYLNWDSINLSLTGDMKSTTDTMGRQVNVDSKVFKRGAAKIRMDVKGGIKVPQGNSSIALANFYMLKFPLKDEAYIVYPTKKSYMELDPEKAREMMGELKEEFEDKSATIEKKEKLGEETVDGHLCDKYHIIMTLHNGTNNDVTAWLARDLKGFPIKIISRFKTPRGVTGTNKTIFTNIKRTLPENSLFEIPDKYIKCKNFVELLSGGKFGKRLKKR